MTHKSGDILAFANGFMLNFDENNLTTQKPMLNRFYSNPKASHQRDYNNHQ